MAEKELENDLEANIWLSEKVQSALISDYRDISDRYDKQLVLDDVLIQSLVKQAIDKAIQFDSNPDKYYKYLDFNEILKVQAVSNFTMKNKLELISRGFMCYKIKQYIESLRGQLNQEEVTDEKDIDICSKLSFLPKSNSDPTHGNRENYQISNNESTNEEYTQEYLDQNGSAIGMNGQPMKKYLAKIEKKLGHALSSI